MPEEKQDQVRRAIVVEDYETMAKANSLILYGKGYETDTIYHPRPSEVINELSEHLAQNPDNMAWHILCSYK